MKKYKFNGSGGQEGKKKKKGMIDYDVKWFLTD